MKPVCISPQALLLIESLLKNPADWRYGYDLSRETGLKSGTVYPILMRLADKLLLENRWEWGEAGRPGRPPQHMYRLTSRGQKWSFAAMSRTRKNREQNPPEESADGGKTRNHFSPAA